MLSPSSLSYFFLLFILITASYYDLRRKRIPRWLNKGIMVSILVYAAVYSIQHPRFAAYSIIAFAVPYLLWRVNLIGGADAKLLSLASLVLAEPSKPSFALPLLFTSLSYAMVFLMPDLKILRLGWMWVFPPVLLVWILAPGMVLPVLLVLLFVMKSVDMSITGYSETLPLAELRNHHLVREGVKGGRIVDVSDLDLILRRKGFEYLPPLLLDDGELERIKETWRRKGREEIRVAVEKPGIPGILAATLLYPFVLS